MTTPTDRETVERLIRREPMLPSLPPQETERAKTLRALLDERDAAVARAEAAEAEVERLRELLAESREYELWSAYQTGVVKDGQWCHCFMTDGEWLAEKCGFDPSDGWYDAQAIRDAIPQAARNMEDE